MVSAPAEEAQRRPRVRAVPKTSARARAKRAPAPLGGIFPALSYESDDAAFSTINAVAGRMKTWAWTKMLWLLRYQRARQMSQQRYRRPLRWLAQLYGAELASLWGHLGSAVRTVRGPRGLELV